MPRFSEHVSNPQGPQSSFTPQHDCKEASELEFQQNKTRTSFLFSGLFEPHTP